MTPTRPLIFSSSVFVLVGVLIVALTAITAESRKVSGYNKKEFREYLAAKRRASELEKRQYYAQASQCPAGFYKANDGLCYLNIPKTNRFQPAPYPPQYYQPVQSTRYGPNPFVHSQQRRAVQAPWRQGFGHHQAQQRFHRLRREPQVQRIQRRFASPENSQKPAPHLQYSRRRYGHPIPQNRLTPEQIEATRI